MCLKNILIIISFISIIVIYVLVNCTTDRQDKNNVLDEATCAENTDSNQLAKCIAVNDVHNDGILISLDDEEQG